MSLAVSTRQRMPAARAALVRAGEEPVLAAEGDDAHPALGRIVVELEPAVLEIDAHALHAGQGVADRDGEGRLVARQSG